jgi:hypothetical protein
MNRDLHYYFAHGLLRALAARDPADFVARALEPGASAWFVEMWNRAGREAAMVEPMTAWEQDFTVHRRALARADVCVVTMPPAEQVAEAIMIAVVVSRAGGSSAEERKPRAFRFFTLEHDVDPTGGTRTAIGEWDGAAADAPHVNHGAGPQPTPDAFIDAIAALL